MSKKIDVSGSVTPSIENVHVTKSTKELTNQKLKQLMQEEGRLVKGIFQCFENPGATQKITYKKYPTPAEMRKRGSDGGLEPFAKTMKDGYEYEIPLYVARFLNGTDVTAGALSDTNKKNPFIGTCSYGIHGFKYSGGELPASQLGSGPGGETGIPVPIIGITQRKKRYGFQSLEFAGAA